jgi:nucleotide-binding universal stress UspA family protein
LRREDDFHQGSAAAPGCKLQRRKESAMTFKDILFHIDSYPEPTSETAIDQVVGFVKALSGRVTALALAVRIPLHSNRLADYLIKLTEIAQEAESKSHQACVARLEYFTRKAEPAGVMAGRLHETAELFAYSDHLAKRAETRDFCIVPLGQDYDGQIEAAQTVLFASGRPVLVFKPGPADLPTRALDTVVIAWDGSQRATRALHEALPILQQAREVRLLTVLGEKPAATSGIGAEPLRHLEAYGVQAHVDEVDAAGRSIGEVFDAYLAERHADLLVMGAYAHSRLREFIMGGATEHVLHRPKAAVFLAH